MKGFAAGWVMMVSSAGSFVFVWICQALLQSLAQTQTAVMAPALTFFILGGILLVLQFFGSFLLVPPPTVGGGGDPKELERPILDEEDKVEAPPALNTAGGGDDDDDGKAVMTTLAVFKSIQFWLVMLVFFANLFPVLGILSILASYLQNRFPGTSAGEAANILALVNVIGTVMRLLVGFLTSCVSSFVLFTIALGVQTALFVLLFFEVSAPALTLWEFAAVCIVAKVCYGSGFTLVNLLVDQVFGTKTVSYTHLTLPTIYSV